MKLKNQTITLSTNGKKIELDVSKLTFPEVAVHPDCTFVDRHIISLNDIHIPDRKDSENRVRQGSGIDTTHVDRIVSSIELKGILVNEPPPAVIRRTQKQDGVTYQFSKGPKGDHRLAAFKQLGITHWIFDEIILSSDNRWADKDVGLIDNDHAPSKPTDKRTVETLLGNMLVEGRWEDVPVEELRDTFRDYLDFHCSSMHGNAKNSIITNVMKKFPEYNDTVEYSPEEAEKWVEKHTNFKHSGGYDKSRDACGWLVPEGYMDKRLYQLIRKYGTENRKSYLGFHTKTPKSGSSVDAKREVSMDLVEELYSCLDSVFEYKQEHGEYPFWVEYFLPADRAGGENLSKSVPSKNVQKNSSLNKVLKFKKAA